jgi:hypothetical protein
MHGNMEQNDTIFLFAATGASLVSVNELSGLRFCLKLGLALTLEGDFYDRDRR